MRYAVRSSILGNHARLDKSEGAEKNPSSPLQSINHQIFMHNIFILRKPQFPGLIVPSENALISMTENEFPVLERLAWLDFWWAVTSKFLLHAPISSSQLLRIYPENSDAYALYTTWMQKCSKIWIFKVGMISYWTQDNISIVRGKLPNFSFSLGCLPQCID